MTQTTQTSLYRRLLRYIKPYRFIFALAMLCMIIVAVTEPIFAELLKRLWSGFNTPETSGVYWIPVIIVALFFFRGALNFGVSYSLSWVSNRVITDIRAQLFDKLLSLPTEYHDHHSSGRLISRISNDVNGVSSAATSAVTSLIKDTVTVIALLGYLFYLNWQMTLTTLVVVPAVMAVVKTFSKRMRSATKMSQESLGELVHVLEEAISGQKIVKIFGGQDYEKKRFDHTNRALRSQAMRQTVAAAATSPLTQVFVSLALSAVIYFALYKSSQNQLTADEFIAFLTAMILLLSPIKSLADVNSTIQKGLAAAESVFVLLDEEPEEDTGQLVLAHVNGDLRFNHVSFQYPTGERHAINNISFTASAGKTIALVGPSGSGKTTIANLIPRFYKPTNGTISLDGHDLQDFALKNLRQHIAIVSQDIILFNDTIAANIAYGAPPTMTREEIIEAANAANAWEFICEMPDGLDTLIGERGLRVSGGQRQRIAIARALLNNAPVLILDEATSALDTESERKVQDALDRLMEKRTTIVIAHRLSTIEKADCIIVMQRSHIVESGTHAQLLKQKGAYASLYELQFSEQEENDPLSL